MSPSKEGQTVCSFVWVMEGYRLFEWQVELAEEKRKRMISNIPFA